MAAGASSMSVIMAAVMMALLLFSSPVDGADMYGHQTRLKQKCPFKLSENEFDNPPDQTPNFRQLEDLPPLYSALEPTEKIQAIPRQMIMTHFQESVPVNMYRNLQNTKKLNLEYDLFYFSDLGAREMIQTHMSPRTLAAYDSLGAGQLKGELFKYCYLYVYGGVFVEAKLMMEAPLSSVLESGTELLLTFDSAMEVFRTPIIGAIPHHPVVANILEKATSHILRQRMDEYCNIAGSPVVTSVMERIFPTFNFSDSQFGLTKNEFNSLKVLNYSKMQGCAIGTIWSDYSVESRFAITSYAEYKQEMRWYIGARHSVKQLFANNSLYIDRASHMFQLSSPRQQQTTAGGAAEGKDGGGGGGGEDVAAAGVGMPVEEECPQDSLRPPKLSVKYIAQVEREVSDMLARHPALKTTTASLANIHGAAPASRIPKTIVQMNAFHRVPKRMRQAMQTVIDLNPEFEHRFFSQEAAGKYVERNCGAATGRAFHTVRELEHKQDLFKYCFLFHDGGVYVDSEYAANGPLFDVVSHADIVIAVQPPAKAGSLDRKEKVALAAALAQQAEDDLFGDTDGQQHKSNKKIAGALLHKQEQENGDIGLISTKFMAAVPFDAVIKQALQNAVANIEAKTIPPRLSHLTGSGVFTEAFNKLVGPPLEPRKWGHLPLQLRILEYRAIKDCMFDEIRNNVIISSSSSSSQQQKEAKEQEHQQQQQQQGGGALGAAIEVDMDSSAEKGGDGNDGKQRGGKDGGGSRNAKKKVLSSSLFRTSYTGADDDKLWYPTGSGKGGYSEEKSEKAKLTQDHLYNF